MFFSKSGSKNKQFSYADSDGKTFSADKKNKYQKKEKLEKNPAYWRQRIS